MKDELPGFGHQRVTVEREDAKDGTVCLVRRVTVGRGDAKDESA